MSGTDTYVECSMQYVPKLFDSFTQVEPELVCFMDRKRLRSCLVAFGACIGALWSNHHIHLQGLGLTFAAGSGLSQRIPRIGMQHTVGLFAEVAAPSSTFTATAIGSLLMGVFVVTRMLPQRLSRRCLISCAASSGETLARLAADFPENFDKDDMFDFKKAYKKLPDKIDGFQDVSDKLVGTWKLEWSNRAGRTSAKKPSPMSLKLKTYGALPAETVSFVDEYVRVSETSYELIQTFTLPEAKCEAALVFSGSWNVGLPVPAPGMSVPARTRCTTELKTVRLALSSVDSEASSAMLEKIGLSKFTEAVGINPEALFNDVEIMGKAIFSQVSRSGDLQILSRVDASAVSFLLD